MAENKFLCEKCPYVSSYKSHLKVHVKSVHENVREFKCEECSYEANQKSTLKRHVNGVHEKLQPYKCNKCPYTATYKSSLNRHAAKYHAGEGQLKCEICPFSAFSVSELKMHQKTIHVKVKDFNCDLCGYSSSLSHNLQRHIRGHLGVQSFSCSDCTRRRHRRFFGGFRLKGRFSCLLLPQQIQGPKKLPMSPSGLHLYNSDKSRPWRTHKGCPQKS